MADCTPGVAVQAADVNLLNLKLPVDDQYNNQRETFAANRAWEDLKLRRAHNVASFDHFINMTTAGSTATAQQTGQDTTATAGGAEEAANSQVAANIANLATTMTPIIVQGLSEALVTAFTAALPTIIAAAGKAANAANPTPAAGA